MVMLWGEEIMRGHYAGLGLGSCRVKRNNTPVKVFPPGKKQMLLMQGRTGRRVLVYAPHPHDGDLCGQFCCLT